MRLFVSDSYSSAMLDGKPEFLTPLGTVGIVPGVAPLTNHLELSSHVNKHKSRDSTIYEWLSSECLLEALIIPFSSNRSIVSSELSCEAVVFRVKALSSQLYTQFTLNWLPGYRWTEGFPESGEGLEAKTWVNEQWKVTIGTEDREFLAARAKTRMWMPDRLASIIDSSTREIIQVTPDSMSVILPKITEGELCQVQFVIASNRRKEEDISTWLAVDQQPLRLLNAGDCESEAPPL